MKQMTLRVESRSPLAIRADHAPEGSATARTIPGTTVMGSFAAAHRMLRPEKSEEFITLFLQEQIWFPVLSPALFKVGAFQGFNLPVKPLPKTAQTCKRFPGFQVLRGESVTEARHGVRDSLLDWAVFSLFQADAPKIGDLLATLEEHANCQVCGKPMDHISGYYRRNRETPTRFMKAEAHTRLQTRTGINREWGVVEESILYNREVFDEDMCFWGQLLLPEDERLWATMADFIEEVTREGVLRIGTGRTRGLGCVEITKVVEERRREPEAFAERLRRFDARIKDRLRAAHVQQLADASRFYFAITLTTPTILCDAFLRYRTQLDAAALLELLPCPVAGLGEVYRASSLERITGWNELWGTPRPNDYALAAGSTFLFACEQPQDQQLVQALFALEETGIGRRRAEGFGRLLISDPFHLEGEQL